MADIILPELAEGVDKAVVSFWHKDIGESISKGEDLVEMLTDKATFNVPATVTGKLVSVNAEEGQEVKVGDILASVEEV
jgi:pyruvate/2-oxoglutarate dehydrogenase complex dihydrolipoamide acyltransferase (E2) component